MHPKVKYWVRNIAQQPQTSFWLPTATDYFYPDFVCELLDGSIAVIEYKGEVYVTNDDSKEKNLVGLQWVKGSEGKRRFLMARSKTEDGRSLELQLNELLS
jgi:type III restriction enzyme